MKYSKKVSDKPLRTYTRAYDFANDTSCEYGRYSLAGKLSYLQSAFRRSAFFTGVVELLWLIWPITASLAWGLDALLSWIMFGFFGLRTLMLLASMLEIEYPQKIATSITGHVKEGQDRDRILRIFSIFGGKTMVGYYMWFAKYIHPLWMLFVIICELGILVYSEKRLFHLVNILLAILSFPATLVVAWGFIMYGVVYPRERAVREVKDDNELKQIV